MQVKEQREQRMNHQKEAGWQKRHSRILKVRARAQQIISTGDDLHTDG